MPTKAISPRARLLSYFATAYIGDVETLLDDARAILTARKQAGKAFSGSGTLTPQPQATKPAAKKQAGKANGKLADLGTAVAEGALAASDL